MISGKVSQYPGYQLLSAMLHASWKLQGFPLNSQPHSNHPCYMLAADPWHKSEMTNSTVFYNFVKLNLNLKNSYDLLFK